MKDVPGGYGKFLHALFLTSFFFLHVLEIEGMMFVYDD